MSLQDVPEHILQDLVTFQGNEIARLRVELGRAQVSIQVCSIEGKTGINPVRTVPQKRIRSLESQNAVLGRTAADAVQREDAGLQETVPNADETDVTSAIPNLEPVYNGTLLQPIAFKKLKQINRIVKGSALSYCC